MGVNLSGRSFLKLLDLTTEEIEYLLKLSKNFKDMKRAGVPHRYLEGKNIVLLFQKTSTRTRCAFEVGGMDLGMGVTYLDPGSSQMGKKESIEDTARVLGRMYDGIEFRGFAQDDVEELAAKSGVPVWNGLTTEWHPTQMLADILTVQENFNYDIKGKTLVFMGDCKNNVARSLMVVCSKLGMNFVACGPEECMPADDVIEACKPIAEANGCTIKLNKEPIVEYLNSNIVLLKWMIAEGYGDRRTLERRIQGMEKWLADPQLLEADADAEYAAVIDIDLADIKEPILCAPNDPDDARLLSDVQGEKIDEVFIGSCMTNIGHFRAAGKLLDSHKGQLPTRLWVAPPTRMDAAQLTEEGYYSVFGKSGARIEIPGCSLCMGNQARVADGATVVSTSTRNFPNRLGTGANVYLASAELAAVASLLGKLPTPEEYQTFVAQVDKTAEDTYRYLNFNQLDQYTEKADGVIFQTAV